MKVCCTEGAYSPIWTMMAPITVVGLPTPPMNGSKYKTHLSLTKRFSIEENENRETLSILWSRLWCLGVHQPGLGTTLCLFLKSSLRSLK